MKVWLYIFVLAVPCTLAASTLVFDVPVSDLGYSIEVSDDYHRIVVPGSFSVSEPGDPELPVVTYTYLIPSKSRCSHVEIIDEVWEMIPGEYTIYPQQEMHPVTEEVGFTQPNPDVYNAHAFYPVQVLAHTHSGTMRGFYLCQIAIVPFRYHPVSHRLSVLTRLVVRIHIERAGECTAPRRQTNLAARTTDRIVAAMVVNSSMMHQADVYPSFYIEENPEDQTPTLLPSLFGAPVDLLIITTEAQRDAYCAFAHFKKQHGYNTAVRTVTWIRQQYAGNDNAERLRNFIKDAVEQWGVVYVLLGGNDPYIPTRWVWMPPMYDQWPVHIVSDLYFSDLDGNWNADADERFGENEDSLDFYPDVFIGRLPTENGQQVLDYMDKEAAYLDPGNPDAFERALFFTSDLDVSNDAYEMAQRLAGHLPSYMTPTYLNNGPRTALEDAIHDGYGVIMGIGHGDINNIRVRNYPRENATNFFFDSLTNYDAAGLLIVITCYTNTFQGNCLARHWIMNPHGGGIGYIGPSSFSEAYLHELYTTVQIDSLFALPLAGVLAQSKIEFAASAQWHNWYRLYQFSINLLGDPGLALWDSIPAVYASVSVSPETISVGYDTVTIAVDPATDFTVVFTKDEDVFVLDSTGSDTLQRQIKTESPGYLHYTVMSSGYIAHYGSLFVQPREPYLVYDDHEVIDTVNNANGIVNPGEEIFLYVTISNQGGAPAQQIHTQLVSTDTFVTMVIDTASFLDIGAGQQGRSSTPFYFSVSEDVPDEHSLNFEIILDNSISTSRDSFHIVTFAPELVHFSQEFIRTADTVVIMPSLVNYGHSIADSVYALVKPYSDTLVIIDSIVRFPRIAPDEIVSPDGDSFRLYVAYPGSDVRYNYRVYHNDSELIDEEILLGVPSAADSVWVLGGQAAVVLEWTAVANAVGYRVYRSLTPDGPYIFLKNHLEPVSQFEDTDVLYGQEYYYYVTTIDVFMNESEASDTVIGRLNPPLAAGWPQIVYDYLFSSPNFGDIDPFYPGLEIVVCGKEGNIYAWHHDGSPVIGDGRIFSVSPAEIWCSPAIGDVDADGSLEIVFGNRTSTDNLYVINNQGSCLPGWPHSASGIKIGSPVLADLDLDDDLEIIIWNIYADLYLLHHDATGVYSADGLLKDLPGIALGSPAVGDINGDGYLEIVCCGGSDGDSLYVWASHGVPCPPFPIFIQSGGLTYSVVLGNVCGDERPEICFYADNTDRVYLVSPDGIILWYKDMIDVADVEGSPIIADVTRDGHPEIICGFKAGITVLDSLGNALDGYPDWRHDAKLPIVCDVDHGEDVEIVVGSKDWNLYAYKQNGELASAFPIRLDNRIESSPAAFDIDADGKLELMTSSNDYFFYVYDLETEHVTWPRFRFDLYNTGLYGSEFLPGVTTSDKTTVARFRLSAKPTVFVNQTVIELMRPSTAGTSEECDLKIYDAAGRLVKQFDRTTLRTSPFQSIIWNGEDNTGRSVSAGVYFVRFTDKTHAATNKIVKIK